MDQPVQPAVRLAAGGRTFSSDAPEANDRGALTEFIFLILALAIVFRLAAQEDDS